MKHKNLVLLLLLLGATRIFAQSTVGNDFWVTFMPNLRQEHPGRALYLKMSAARACSGIVTNPRCWSNDYARNSY